MATIRQIAANQKNAQLSTGPKTDEGKAQSRANALQHGLAGAGIVTLDDDQEKIAKRLSSWRSNYMIATQEDEWQFNEYVVNSVRIDRCHLQEAVLITNQADRAELCWDIDRRVNAEEIGDALKRKPARTVSRLRTTRHGCDWLLERWTGLLGIFERNGAWSEAQTALAFDLLGTAPELRMEHPWNAGETAVELANRQIAELEDLQAQALDTLDHIEQQVAKDGMPIEPSRALTLLHRYEAACLRRLNAARNRLVSAAKRAAMPASAQPRVLPLPPSPSRPAPEEMNAFTRGWFEMLDKEKELALEPPTAPATPPPSRPMNRQARRAAEKLARSK
jgi:hypothetical protein